MQEIPSIATVEEHPTILDGGHLWLLESLDGLPIRFRVEDSGLCVFGDADRTFDDEIPPAYRAATRWVRTRLDRDALRAAAIDLPGITFVGVATVRRGIDYDWDRLPPFVGTDVHSRHRGTYLPPDAVERAYDGIALPPVNALSKEVRATDFHPETFTFPNSAWYDGPAAGVVLRNKTGGRALLPNPAAEPPPTPVELDKDPATLGRTWTTADRVRAVMHRLSDAGMATDAEIVRDRVIETIYREEYWTIVHADRPVDTPAFRAAVGERVRDVLAGRE